MFLTPNYALEMGKIIAHGTHCIIRFYIKITLLDFNNRVMTSEQCLEYFLSLQKGEFTRKDFMNIFKNISSSTARRDLAKGVENNILEKFGKDNKTKYRSTT